MNEEKPERLPDVPQPSKDNYGDAEALAMPLRNPQPTLTSSPTQSKNNDQSSGGKSTDKKDSK